MPNFGTSRIGFHRVNLKSTIPADKLIRCGIAIEAILAGAKLLYPVVSTEEWCESYDLEVVSDECDGCSRMLTTTLPYVDKVGFGLISPLCPCGSKGRLSTEQLRAGRYAALIEAVVAALEPEVAANVVAFTPRNERGVEEPSLNR